MTVDEKKNLLIFFLVPFIWRSLIGNLYTHYIFYLDEMKSVIVSRLLIIFPKKKKYGKNLNNENLLKKFLNILLGNVHKCISIEWMGDWLVMFENFSG